MIFITDLMHNEVKHALRILAERVCSIGIPEKSLMKQKTIQNLSDWKDLNGFVKLWFKRLFALALSLCRYLSPA